jgi:hypothetical protein
MSSTERVGREGWHSLNAVRVLCTATLENRGILAQDKTIKMNPAMSISKYEVGDEIKLDAGRFVQLSDALLAEIEKKFAEMCPDDKIVTGNVLDVTSGSSLKCRCNS